MMRTLWPVAVLLSGVALFGMATSAQATGGLVCRPVSGAGPTLSLVIGRGASSVIAGANLRQGHGWRSTFAKADGLTIAQSWIDEERLLLDLADANAMWFEARLRARFVREGRQRPAIGTLVRSGRTYRVRCVEG